MRLTIRVAISRAAIAVDVVNELAPLCKPLTILPSFWYCSIGSCTRSLKPCISLTKEYIGPTPPNNEGS